MENSISPEHSIMLCMATLYIAMTEAITEMCGRSVEPAVNRMIEKMVPHLPPDAADMCAFILEFATRDETEHKIQLSHPDYQWWDEVNALAATAH